jgi:hypothetical protein
MLLLLLLLLLLITTNVVVAAISLPAHTFKRLIILQKIQEGAATASAADAAKRTCEQCFTSILRPEQVIHCKLHPEDLENMVIRT